MMGFPRAAALTTLLICWVHGQNLPAITLDPTGGVYNLDSVVTVVCEAENADSIHWVHNGNTVVEDAVISIDATSLVISSLSDELTGSYACVATDGQGSVVSGMAEVQLAVLEASLLSEDDQNPHQLSVQEGQPTILECGSITSVPPVAVDWKKLEGSSFTSIDHDLERAIIGLDSKLYLQNPSAILNRVIFECSVLNRVTRTNRQGYIQITVEESTSDPAPPTILSAPRDTTVNVGDSAFFECIVGGSPVQEVSWTLPPALDAEDPTKVRFSQGGAMLQVREVEMGDVAGGNTFTCGATGVEDATATLTVQDVPTLTPESPTLTPTPLPVPYGTPFSLSCEASGLNIQWAWYYNGEALDSTGPTFSIENSVEEDTGIYQCFARNPAGFDSSAAFVRVQTIPPSFVTGGELPPLSVAFADQQQRFRCEAEGAPPPEYQWLKDGIPLSTGPLVDLSELGSLLISAVSEVHRGNYTCRAVNRLPQNEAVIGMVDSSAWLFVITPTEVTLPVASPRSFPIQLGVAAILPCEVSHHEGVRLSFAWTKDGNPLEVSENPGDRLSFQNSSISGSILIASPVDGDAGVYMCTISSTYQGVQAPDVSSATITVQVTAVPIGPKVVSAVPTSSEAIKVGWFFPGTPTALDGYAIEIRKGNSGDWIEVATQSIEAITEYTIEGLSPFTLYGVRAIAIYVLNGERVPGDAATVLTFEATPTQPPFNIKTTFINRTAQLIVWEALQQGQNGIITSYTIRYQVKDSGRAFVEIVTPSNDTQFTLTGLQPGTAYEISIAASTVNGTGPFSQPLVSALRQEETPVYRKSWFIVAMFFAGVGLLLALVLVVCALRYCCRSTHKTKKYHVRHSGYFGNPTSDDINLSEDAVMDYESRTRKENTYMSSFGSVLGSESVDGGGSSIAVSTSGVIYAQSMSGPAPSYINPPPFEEALKHRTHRNPSTSSTVDKPEYIYAVGSDWSGEQGSKRELILTLSNPEYQSGDLVQYSYEDESDSLEKPSYSSSDPGTEELEDRNPGQQDAYHLQDPATTGEYRLENPATAEEYNPATMGEYHPATVGEYHLQNPATAGEYHLQDPATVGEYHLQDPAVSDDYHLQELAQTGEYHLQNPVETDDYHLQNPAETGEYHLQNPVETGEYHLQNPAETGEYHLQNPAETGEYHLQNPVEMGEYHHPHDSVDREIGGYSPGEDRKTVQESSTVNFATFV